MDLNQLKDRIRSAFSDVTRDGGINLQQGRAIDDHALPQEIRALEDPNIESWNMVSREEVGSLHDAFRFLDLRGQRFYLPVYLIYILDSLDKPDHVSDWFLDFLSQSSAVEEISPLLSLAQKRCVVEFLAFVFLCPDGQIDPYAKEDVANALTIWAPGYVDGEQTGWEEQSGQV